MHLEDLPACLHYSDDWDVLNDEDWEDTYDDPKVEADVSTATNSYKVYTFLYNKRHNPANVTPLKQCINNLTHSLLQQGDFMRRTGFGSPPSAVKDIKTYVCIDGKKV